MREYRKRRLTPCHMPIGLDIAAETPEEIAVSVAAECIMRRAEMRRGNA